ncbi:MAG: A24 family peptidase [Thermoanaerobaculia bacterium]
MFGAGLLLTFAGLWKLWKGVDGMGLGDVKMLAMVGAFLGPYGVVVTLVAASLFGSVVGLALLAHGAVGLGGKLPFGVFSPPAHCSRCSPGNRWFASTSGCSEARRTWRTLSDAAWAERPRSCCRCRC